MNKLKNKVFWVIFAILTVFLITVISIFNIQGYYSVKDRLKQNLISAEKINERNNKMDFNPPEKPDNDLPQMNERPNNVINPDDTNEIHTKFMDSVVYTILLNSDNEIIDIINHSNLDTTEDEITEIANSIIKKNTTSTMKVNNLYFTNYVYSYQKGSSLIIIDISNYKSSLLTTLEIGFIIFIILEVVIIYLSKIITSWIIRPAMDSFNKQKQFIADASHELKTPLSVIMASAEELEDEKITSKYLDNIKSESSRMSNLIQNLLNLARLENINDTKVYTNINLSKIIELTSLTYESLMFESKIKLGCSIEENIDFLGDSEEIKQLVAILIDNAIKHSKKNGTIFIELKKSKNEILFSVKNQGKEIPADKLDKIFERFYRVDESRNRDDNRYGLGLAIAKNIVENHNGKIFVSCMEGVTTFKIIFKQI